MDRALRALHAFVHDDPFVFSKYLVFAEVTPGCVVESLQSQILFVLWFVIIGRDGASVPTVIPQPVRDLITSPPYGPHMLMQYVADQQKLELSGDALRAWYYDKGLRGRRLAPFLGQAELAALHGAGGSIGLGDQGIAPDAKRGAVHDFADRLARLAKGASDRAPVVAVSIVGYHRTVLGIGEDARCLFECLCEAGITAELVDVSPPGLDRIDTLETFAPFEAERPTAPLVIFCLPAIEMIWAITDLGLTRTRAGQYRVGYWPWETSAFPAVWAHVYDQVDEIWASTAFIREAYSSGTAKPVIDMPLHVDVGARAEPDGFADLLGSKLSVLGVFDFNSRIERKNPLGAIEAFRRAFPAPVRDVQLILKTVHAATRPDDLQTVLAAIGGDDRIVLRDAAITRPALNGLIARSDVYLALHRAEGFGRPIAEAMLLGTPVVATGWSGCADFLSEDTGFPVRSTLRPVAPHEYPFASGLWAEPDLDHAAHLLRTLHADPAYRRSRVGMAKAFVERHCGLGPVSRRLLERVAAITATLEAAMAGGG